MRIRAATSDDTPALRKLLDEQNAFHVHIQPSTFALHPTDEERIRIVEHDPDAVMLVADDGGSLVGLIELKLLRTKELPILVQKTYVGIQEMFVEEGRLGQGIGAALMEAARSWGRARGAASVRTSVVPTNGRARAFYAKHGFADRMIQIEADL